MTSFSKAEKTSKPPIDEMFADVYKEPTKHLRKQQAELHAHLKEYGQHYPIGDYKGK